jgi:hypothetical protein
MHFLRDAAVSELYAASDDGQPPPAGTIVRWFLLPSGDSADRDLSLAQTFALKGTYIFLESPLPAGGEQAFANAAWIFLDDASFRNPRIAWFPSAVPVDGELSGYVLTTPESNPSVTGRALVITYQNYALVVDSGTPFGLDVSVPAFTLTQTNQTGIALTTEFGATTLAGAGSVAIPLTGADAGSFQFPLSLDQTGGVSDLAHLDVGIRTYYATPLDESPNGDEGLISSLRYPVINETETVQLNASLAPWSVAEARSYFRFAAAGPAGLRSCYSTVSGFNLSVTPYTDASGPSATPAQLVFALRPSAFPASSDDLYTLVPKGDFLVAALQETGVPGPIAEVAETPPGTRLMCGLSGVEYIGLASASAITFFTGGAAYADGFNPDVTVPSPTKLTTAATTAWALPCQFDAGKAASLTYFAQPDGAVLYQQSQQADFIPLVYLEVPANTLASTIGSSNAVPLLPYAGIASDDPDLDTYSSLESKVVSTNRRATVAATGGAPPPATLEPRFAIKPAKDTRFGGATPQGLLALFTDTSLEEIDEQVLAQMPDGSRFSLHGLPNGDPLRTAIFSNQLFLVLSNPAAIAPYLSTDPNQRQIVIDTWTFALDAPEWIPEGTPAALDTAMIFKYTQGRLSDLINDTGAWTKAQSGGGPAPIPFNTDETATSARLAKQINDAIAAYDDGNGDTDFETFVNAVTDPTWQGIVFFNVTTPLAKLPDQCKGLAAGIDPALFRAHHVAIETAKIDVTTTPLSIAPSSMFGLINYQAPSPLQPHLGDYQFQVEQLKVLFLNSAIAGFSSVIDFQINSLFGEPATLEDFPNNVVKLYGVYQKHVVNGQVQESYLFQTALGQPATFDMTSGVLNAVQLAKGQFITTAPQQRSWAIAATGAARVSNTVTITTSVPHGINEGDTVAIAGVTDASFNGSFLVLNVLSSTSFTYAQSALADATSGNGAASTAWTDSQFVFWGLLDFKALANFDLFSFGRESGATAPAGLNFSNLSIEMTFDPNENPSDPAFVFNADKLTFDLAASVPRQDSFFSHFPVTLSSFTQATQGAKPEDGGFMGVQSPLTQSSLQTPWFALNFNVNLGSLGALAAQAGFIATLVAAWSPNQSTGSGYQVFTGLKLPGSSGSKRSIPIEGLFQIAFKTLEIIVQGSTYILVLYNISFNFFSFAFPPSGQVNFVLFGDPSGGSNQGAGNTSLGWYAAYAKTDSKGSGGSGKSLAGAPRGGPVLDAATDGDAK